MVLKMIGLGFVGKHTQRETLKDKTADQKASVFSYMVNSVFNGEEEEKPKDEYVGYFRDGWNILDFLVVVLGSIVPLATGAGSVSSIRALRILRALRTIPRVPSYIYIPYPYTSNLHIITYIASIRKIDNAFSQNISI